MNRSFVEVSRVQNLKAGIVLVAVLGGVFGARACGDDIMRRIAGDSAPTDTPSVPEEIQRQRQELNDYLEGKTDCIGDLECGDKSKAPSAAPTPQR